MLTKKKPQDRSKFEEKVGLFLGENAEHEPHKIRFTQPPKERFYLPDFLTKAGVYLEAKGRFVSADRMKHLWLKEQHPDKRIVIVFMNGDVKLNKKSKTSYSDWATKNGIEWLNWRDGIAEELIVNADKNSSRNGRRTRRNTRGSNTRTTKVLD